MLLVREKNSRMAEDIVPKKGEYKREDSFSAIARSDDLRTHPVCIPSLLALIYYL